MRSRLAWVALAVALGAPFAQAAFAAGSAGSASHIAAGRQLFEDWNCASCHAMKDAGATGRMGPALDGNAALTREFTISRITHGRGAMPGFNGLMTEEEIATLADYIVARKS